MNNTPTTQVGELSSEHLRLPKIISDGDVRAAAAVLRQYYGARYPRVGETTEAYMGAWFDEFDPSGTRAEHPNEFTADDLVAVALLNTPINLTAGKMIRFDLRDEINTLLSQIPTNVALWEVNQPIDRTWPAWQLETLLLTKVKHIGLTRASKLIARKRPLLVFCQFFVGTKDTEKPALWTRKPAQRTRHHVHRTSTHVISECVTRYELPVKSTSRP